jgi:hypothetical protein
MEQTSLAVLQERAMRAEGEDDVRELRCAQEKNAITLRERITSLTNEIVADQLCLAALERAMEDARSAKANGRTDGPTTCAPGHWGVYLPKAVVIALWVRLPNRMKPRLIPRVAGRAGNRWPKRVGSQGTG